jgi:hypothetical protein
VKEEREEQEQTEGKKGGKMKEITEKKKMEMKDR